ncbi:MAG TPA: hypothetical protein VLA09_01210 [Longimicrobiales bacterium]|nr:hypothetical protein [Longimicrobiales bacterium]
MRAIARAAPSKGEAYRVYLVGGGTAVWCGWREASIDVDLHTDQEELFRDVQKLKERLNINIEFARPEHFVPPLPGADGRHVFLEKIGPVEFHHYDPYSQCFSKIVRGFTRDLDDARHFVSSGLVDPHRLRELVNAVAEAEFSRYPQLSPRAVRAAVAAFLDE